MDPLSLQNVDLAKAVQALLVRQGSSLEGSALMALLGQDVDMLLQALNPEGLQLKLPTGQTITAQGELPYPEGTQLRVRVSASSPGEAGLRLQVKEARPPAAPAILSPLVQGEAQTLAARLGEAQVLVASQGGTSPAPALEPLLRLLAVLADTGQPPALPSTAQLQAAVQQLPADQTAALGRILGAGPLASPQEIAAVLRPLFEKAAAEIASPLPLLAAPAAEDEPGLKELIQFVVAHFQTLAARTPNLPPEHRDALVLWLKDQFQKAQTREEGASARPAPQESAVRPEGSRTQSPLPTSPQAALRVPVSGQAPAASKAEVPESWESWIRGTVTVLTDPAASPREAPFHALQAKEGTAYFEIPLPWAQASPLQIWVESDAPEERHAPRDTTQRVLLGLSFSRLGETRLGLAQGSFGLRIRVWTERPEIIESERERMEEELQALGRPVDLKIHALTYQADGTIPTIRSLVTGPTLSALG